MVALGDYPQWSSALAGVLAYDDFKRTQALPGQYDPFCALAYAIDTSLPIINFGQREKWHPRFVQTEIKASLPLDTQSNVYSFLCEADFARNWNLVSPPTLAFLLTLYRWVHLAFGWFLATMFLAGISGLVGRD